MRAFEYTATRIPMYPEAILVTAPSTKHRVVKKPCFISIITYSFDNYNTRFRLKSDSGLNTFKNVPCPHEIRAKIISENTATKIPQIEYSALRKASAPWRKF